MSWASERCKPQPRYPSLSIVLLCPALRRSASSSKSLWRSMEQFFALLRHRPPVTIQPAPQLLSQVHEPGRGYLRSAVLQHRTPLRPAQLSTALSRSVSRFHAKQRLAIVPSSRLKLGLNSFRRCMSREGDTFGAQFCSTELRYAPLS